MDLYGRRPLMDGARVGPRSTFTNATATLVHDLSFSSFDANATVAHGAADPRSGLGPGGLVGGEGSWGLVLAGSANVELSTADGDAIVVVLDGRTHYSFCITDGKFNSMPTAAPSMSLPPSAAPSSCPSATPSAAPSSCPSATPSTPPSATPSSY